MEDFGAAISEGAEWSFCGQWVMTPVGNQRRLPACGNFAVSYHISAKLAIDRPVYQDGRRRDAIVLSKQEFFDCIQRVTRGVSFCQMYDYVIAYGLHLENFYPYLGLANQPCRCPDLLAHRKVGIRGWRYISGEATVLAALRQQPLAASVLVYNSLIRHRGLDVWGPEEGELPRHVDGARCPVRHAVLLTGYGVNKDGIEYYIAKGSWGLRRWLNGYIRIRRDVPFYISEITEEAYWKD